MNSKSKIILGLSSIVAVSAAVAATSSYAWFTTSRTATMSVSNISVNSPSGALIANATTKGDYGGVSITRSSGSSYNDTIVGSGYTVDVSGTGEISSTDSGNDFYQPIWGATNQGTVAQGMRAHVANSASVLYYREFYITFTNDGEQGNASTENFKVYLNENSKIEAADSTNDKDVRAAKAMRVGFYTVDTNATNATLLTLWDANQESETTDTVHPYHYNFVDNVDAAGATSANNTTAGSYTNPAYGLADYSIGDMDKVKTGHTLHGTPLTVVSTLTEAEKTAQCVTPSALAGKDTYKILVRIWIDGASRACTDDAKQGTVKMTLGFSALV